MCPSNGEGVGQVGQVLRLAGMAERSGASCWTNQITAGRKQETVGLASSPLRVRGNTLKLKLS